MSMDLILTALAIGVLAALLFIAIVRFGPAGKARTPDRFFRELQRGGVSMFVAAGIAAMMSTAFALGLLTGGRDQPGSNVSTHILSFAMILTATAGITLIACRGAAMRSRTFRKWLRGRPPKPADRV